MLNSSNRLYPISSSLKLTVVDEHFPRVSMYNSYNLFADISMIKLLSQGSFALPRNANSEIGVPGKNLYGE